MSPVNFVYLFSIPSSCGLFAYNPFEKVKLKNRES